MLRALDSFKGTPITRAAIQLLPLLLVRPGEFRHMEWTEIHDDTWEIPGEKMKIRERSCRPAGDTGSGDPQ